MQLGFEFLTAFTPLFKVVAVWLLFCFIMVVIWLYLGFNLNQKLFAFCFCFCFSLVGGRFRVHIFPSKNLKEKIYFLLNFQKFRTLKLFCGSYTLASSPLLTYNTSSDRLDGLHAIINIVDFTSVQRNNNTKIKQFNSCFDLLFGESLAHRYKENTRPKLRPFSTTQRQTDLGTLVAPFFQHIRYMYFFI